MVNIGIGFGLSLSMQGRGGKAWRDYDLFETGSGFLYNFSRADTLFQEATGTTPAGVDQNVGLALDVSKWGGKTLAQVLAGQPELVLDANLLVIGDGLSRRVYRQSPTNDVVTMCNVVADKTYWVRRVKLSAGSGSATYRINGSGSNVSPAQGMNSSQALDMSSIFTAKATGVLTLIGDGDGTDFYLDYVSVKEIPGNHASQATSGARPVLKTGGLIRTDGSDDNLLTTFNPTAAVTLALKLKAPAAGQGVKVLMGATHPGAHCYLGMANSGALGAGLGLNALGLVTDNINRSGQTGVLVATADAVSNVLYWNGVQIYAGAASGSPAGATPIRLGARNNSGTADLFAAIDTENALAINLALTPAEVLKLTNAWSH